MNSHRQPPLINVPPSRDGVGASCVALPDGPWRLLIDFLCHRFAAISAQAWRARMCAGEVFDQHGKAVLPDAPYCAGQKIFYFRSVSDEPVIPFEEIILFQDDYLVAVDKPHFLPVTPAGRYVQQTLLVRLKRRLGIDTLAPMHRIDRETAGVVVFTIQPQTRALYQSLFRQHAVSKVYEAIAGWRPDLELPRVMRSRLEEADSFMKMQQVAGEPNAETTIALMVRKGELARYQLLPVSGQRHQLRVQMAALGIPILNDQIYPCHLPEPATGEAPDYSRPLQLLAKSLSFIDPVSGQARTFESGRRLLF